MAKGRKRICVLCGNPIEDNNESIPYKNRYVHSTCFQAASKVIHKDKSEKIKKKQQERKTKPKPQPELKGVLSNEEYVQKNLYYDFLKFNLDELPTSVYALTENIIKKYGFTFQGMYRTLKYMKDVQEIEFGDRIVGLIPYYYSEAEKHYQSVKQVADNNKDIDTSSMYKQKTVRIDPSKKKKVKAIDITTVTGGDAVV